MYSECIKYRKTCALASVEVDEPKDLNCFLNFHKMEPQVFVFSKGILPQWKIPLSVQRVLVTLGMFGLVNHGEWDH